jgi:predicted signal transduction protein with EAL and GGDEF domain
MAAPPNQTASLESQVTHPTQQLSGQTLRNVRDNGEAFKLLSAMGKSIAGTMHLGAIQINPGVSIGAAPISGNARTGTEIMKRADLALYDVKAHGRGHCRLFSDEPAFGVQKASASGLRSR